MSAFSKSNGIRRFYLAFRNIQSDQLTLVGGKGLSLALLSRAGVPVPPGFVITTGTFKAFSPAGLPENYKQELRAAFDGLAAERVAVRSSAVAEDSAEASWAGQFESFLNVSKEGLIEAVDNCWHSAKTQSVRAYASQNNISEDKLALAVVVQAMVEAEVSGVAFSINPVNKNTDEIMVEATYGLGELLVQGIVTPDNYLINKTTLCLTSSQIAAKSSQLIYKDGANVKVKVEPERSSLPCLGEEQLVELAELVKKIEAHYGCPQDIEWAYAADRFYILQSRPITTL